MRLLCGFCVGVTVTECQGCGSARKDLLLCDCIMKIYYCVGSTTRNSWLCSFTTTNYCVLVSNPLISLCSGFKLFDFTVMAWDFWVLSGVVFCVMLRSTTAWPPTLPPHHPVTLTPWHPVTLKPSQNPHHKRITPPPTLPPSHQDTMFHCVLLSNCWFHCVLVSDW